MRGLFIIFLNSSSPNKSQQDGDYCNYQKYVNDTTNTENKSSEYPPYNKDYSKNI